MAGDLLAFPPSVKQLIEGFIDFTNNPGSEFDDLFAGMTRDVTVQSRLATECECDDRTRLLSDEEFCSLHAIDGIKLDQLLTPLDDTPTGCFTQEGPNLSAVTLGKLRRDMGPRGLRATVDTIQEMDNPALEAWLRIAVFLSRHPGHQTPECMRPVDHRS